MAVQTAIKAIKCATDWSWCAVERSEHMSVIHPLGMRMQTPPRVGVFEALSLAATH